MLGPLRAKKLLSRRQYDQRLLLLWALAAIWVMGSIALVMYWNVVPWQMKALAVILLILGTPALSDMFRSYARYTEKWEFDNRKIDE